MPVNWLTDWHYSYEDVFKSPLNSVQSFYKYCMKDDDSLANARLYAVRLLQYGNVSSHCPGSKPESVAVCNFRPPRPWRNSSYWYDVPFSFEYSGLLHESRFPSRYGQHDSHWLGM